MDYFERKQLLKLARDTLKYHFKNKPIPPDVIPPNPKFQEKHGVFVTLQKEGKLRGCIGYIQPIKSLYEAVKENAFNAAFHDSRFTALKEEELPKVEIEISILSVPEELKYKDSLELIRKLKPKVDGVILEKNGREATFLPQVWNEVLIPEDFLRQLSWKAGLAPDGWKSAKIFTYQAEVFKEVTIKK